MTPSRRASTRAIESTTGPRDVFTRIAVGFIQPQALGVDEALRLRAEVDVERHEVGLREEVLEGHVRRAELGLDGGVGPVQVVVQDPSSRSPGARRATAWPIRPNPTIPSVDAVDVRAHQQHRAPRLPLAVADVVVGLGQAPRRRP